MSATKTLRNTLLLHTFKQRLTEDLSDDAMRWRPLWIFTAFRLLIGGAIVVLSLLDVADLVFAPRDAQLLLGIGIEYVIYAVISIIMIVRRMPSFYWQTVLQLGGDLVALIFLSYACQPDSGMALLLIIPCAASGLLLSSQHTYFFPLLAAASLWPNQLDAIVTSSLNSSEITRMALLGITFFGVTFTTRHLSRRQLEAQSRAHAADIDLADLTALQSHVLQQLDTGIIVTDNNYRLRLINLRAANTLGAPETPRAPLQNLSAELASRLKIWEHSPDYTPPAIHAGGHTLLPRFSRLGDATEGGILIYLDEPDRINQRTQQQKLSALGRMSASIAHEIRNPLAAISHAGELLSESPDLPPADKRLTTIIDQQTDRMNGIIENILQLSRPTDHRLENLVLNRWLRQFRIDFIEQHDLTADDRVHYQAPATPLSVRTNSSQLEQVLSNLCENALKYGRNADTGHANITLIAEEDHATGRIILTVSDDGPGVSTEIAEHIFEPFFTASKNNDNTAPKGAGLGLYLARELAQVSGMSLNYQANPNGGSQFQLSFAKT